jgi:hypothetical protein
MLGAECFIQAGTSYVSSFALPARSADRSLFLLNGPDVPMCEPQAVRIRDEIVDASGSWLAAVGLVWLAIRPLEKERAQTGSGSSRAHFAGPSR